MRPYLKKTLHKKRAVRVAQGVGPEFKLEYHKRKKKSIAVQPSLEIGWHFDR
jgi:hypothetical protein